MTSADLHTLTGAYALHALSDRESEEFARHLTACAACLQEVRELQETAARLALAAAETPSGEFRARVMAAIPEVRQLPPRVPASDGPALSPAQRWRRWRHRMPQLALAACLVVAMVAGGFAISAEHQVQQQRTQVVQAQSQAAALSALLAAPDARFSTDAVKGGGSSTVVTSASLRQTAFVFHGLAPLPSAKVYELWYSKDGQMVPAGLVPSTADGATMLTGTPDGAVAVGMTVEPAGGSARPTSAPVVLLPFAAT
ncbi:anti-sigma factor domain-containing protein [Streptacidiphilus sp. N1-1]|uniref:Regulator of SigK n=1 Tax=Streptacidiphilus alkalitolerans TaxID=3342712 RepID=A0ABV6V8V9_9ACTN